MDGVIIGWVVFFSFFGPIYIVACIFSVLKAIGDRKAIQKRNKDRASSSKRMPKIQIIEDKERSKKYRNQTFSNSSKQRANGSESGSVTDLDVGSVISCQGNGIGTGSLHQSSHEAGHDSSSRFRQGGDGSTNPPDSRPKSGEKDRHQRGKKPKLGNCSTMEVTVEKNLQAPPLTSDTSGQTCAGVDTVPCEPCPMHNVNQNFRHGLGNPVREADDPLEGGEEKLPNSTHVEMNRFNKDSGEDRKVMSSPSNVSSRRAERIKTTDLDAISDSERFASDQDKSPETPRRRGRVVARQSADQPQLHHLSRPKPPRQGKTGRGGDVSHTSHTNRVVDRHPKKHSASPNLENTCVDGMKYLESSKSEEEKELAGHLVTPSPRRNSYYNPGEEQCGWMDSPSPVLRTRSEDNLNTDRKHFLFDNPSPSDGGTVNRAFVRSTELPFH